MPDDDVLDFINQQIEDRFAVSVDELRQAVAAAPEANAEATQVVHWHGLLTKAQALLEKAEDDLVAALMTEPVELDESAMVLAHRVNAAVATRDGRVVVIRWLLDPNSVGRQGPGAWRGVLPAAARGPALNTSPPVRHTSSATSARGAVR
ncbi:hypothetical protein ACFC0C_16225 [Streptomyces sp. NPDC056178]|uniref:hypothetical protein n=1 Tax=unclassified Streptomyces TaxID=2593676 RepID=UPI0035DF3C36